MPDGEEAKSLATVEDLCRQFAQWGLNRADAVVAVGGGIVTDTAGFAAAVYHRGVPVVHVLHHPARPDRRRHRRQDRREPARGQEPGRRVLAAVGGALRHRGAGHPAAPRVPQRPRRDGQVPLPRRRRPRRACPSTSASPRCVAIKADGRGRRRARGRPPGHASTTATPSPTPSRSPAHHDLRHGEAVAVGLVFAGELAHRLGRIDADARGRAPPRGRRLRPAVHAAAPGSTNDELVELMGRDKKALDGLTFVLDGPDGVEQVTGVPRPTSTRRSTPSAAMETDRDRRRRARRRQPIVLLLSGPNLNLLGDREPESTAPHPRRPRGRGPGRGRPRTASTSSTCSPTTRATSSTPSTAPGAAAPPSSSTPARSPTTRGPSTTPSPRSTGRSSSCTSRTRRPASRGATPRWWRRSPPAPSPASAATATASRSRPSPASWGPTARDHRAGRALGALPRDGRRRPGRPPAGRCSAEAGRRAARHRASPTSATSPASPARPASLWSPPTSCCSSPTAATASRPPTSWPPPASTARLEITGTEQRRRSSPRRRRPAPAALGLEADARHAGPPQRALRGRVVPRRRAGRHRAAWSSSSGASRTPARSPASRPPRAIADAALAELRPGCSTGPPRPSSRLELDAAMRRLGADRPELRDDRRRRAPTAPARTHRPSGRAHRARATWSCSTSARSSTATAPT